MTQARKTEKELKVTDELVIRVKVAAKFRLVC